ncbi:hypothetical protein N7457_005526 [Penicillium paradoxum]|uniref:uncharacterized protein n=1 Tax=Penicillium paradoxum TaxID=176176 RepID=UPI0025491827|nr:uncharacterized protein N7457_005526 [Penicillium paradoxum]KAJ5780366.1 hypothetical protein N7457_005526 [Penicillium paradoxum]
MPNKSQSKVPKSEQESHIMGSQVNAPEMADQPQPASSDVDETMTRDYKEAIDQSNVLSGDALRHAKPQSSTGYYEPTEEETDISWRPDPSGHPRRTF